MQTGPTPPDNYGSEEDVLLGTVLHNSYRVVRKIGDGGMGAVYEATHVRLTKKHFAIKLLSMALLDQPEVYARFRREAEIATELGHQNIVDVIDFNELPTGQPYMVMEFLEGEDLGERLRRTGALRIEEVSALMTQVGGALHAVHQAGIVHRDMKPENIFLVAHADGALRAKVLDFGISKIRHSKTVVTQHNVVFGTPYYMSPEQAEGNVKDIDHTTDIFALGAICYQALSGAMPFDAPTIPGVLYRVCHTEPTPISDIVSGFPERLNDILQQAMAKKKQARYQNVQAFVSDVNGVLLTLTSGVQPVVKTKLAAPESTTLSQASGEVPLDVPRRNKGPIIGAAIVGLIALVVGGVVLLGGSNNAPAPPPVAATPSVAADASPQKPNATTAPDVAAPATKDAAASVTTARLQLAIEPPEATVIVDGKPTTENPLKLEKDRSYELRVEARGYEPKKRLITAAKDDRLEIALDKQIVKRSKKRKPSKRSSKRRKKKRKKLRFDDLD